MMASQPAMSLGSSTAFISGEPHALSGSDIFADTFIDTLVEHVDAGMAETQNELRETASGDPEWSMYAKGLFVEADSGDIRYYYEGPDEDAVLALEFGSMDQPPAPLIRSTAASSAAEISRDISQRMENENPVA